MKTMHKLYYLCSTFLLSGLLACSDSENEPPINPVEPEMCRVEIRIGAEGTEQTKAEYANLTRDGELIHSLLVLLVNDESNLEAKWDLNTDGSSYNGNPDEGEVTEWRSGDIPLPAGEKTIYAFANLEGITYGDANTPLLETLNSLEIGSKVSLDDIVINNPVDKVTFPIGEKFIPMSVKQEGINISEATENIRVELVRLLGRVDVVVSSDRDRTISSFTMKNFATKVPLFDGDASLEATEDVTISFDNVAINASSTHEFSFYVNETLNESANTGGFAVSLTTGDATLEGSTPINKTIPRNSVLPLKLSLSDYQLQIKVMAQVAPIGGYPVNVYQTAYSLTNDYAIESLPEGCTFTIDGSLIYMDGTEISGDWSWAWNLTDEDDKYIQLDGSGTEKPVNGHIAALQDDTSHALSFSVTYQGEVIREGTLTINKIGALGDNYPQTRATDWSAAPRWYIPVALTRNP